MRKVLVLFVIALALVVCSCSLFAPAITEVSKNVNISWGKDSTAGRPIDSILIKFEPVYWHDTLRTSTEVEKDFISNGYRVWQLSSSYGTRFEVGRKDTMIYIYQKSK